MDGQDKTNDITELKLALSMLRESELKYRALFDNANDAIFLMEKGVIIDCNLKFLTMFGCSREQIIGQTTYRFSPPFQPDGRDSREKAIEKGEAALSGEPQFFEWKHCRYDGTLFDAEVSLNRIELDKDKLVLQAMIRDVSERRETEKRLRISEEKYRSIFENAIEGIFQTTPEGKVITANTTFASMYGYESPQEMIETVTDIGKAIYVNIEDRERIFMMGKNSISWLEAYFGIIKTGAWVNPLNFRFTDENIVYCGRAAEPSCFLFEEEYAPLIQKSRSGILWDCLKGSTCRKYHS
jgi:PAS domain S-box-containing protein